MLKFGPDLEFPEYRGQQDLFLHSGKPGKNQVGNIPTTVPVYFCPMQFLGPAENGM